MNNIKSEYNYINEKAYAYRVLEDIQLMKNLSEEQKINMIQEIIHHIVTTVHDYRDSINA